MIDLIPFILLGLAIAILSAGLVFLSNRMRELQKDLLDSRLTSNDRHKELLWLQARYKKHETVFLGARCVVIEDVNLENGFLEYKFTDHAYAHYLEHHISPSVTIKESEYEELSSRPKPRRRR